MLELHTTTANTFAISQTVEWWSQQRYTNLLFFK